VLYARADNRRRRVLIAITSCLLAIQAMRSKGKASIKTIPYFSEDMARGRTGRAYPMLTYMF